MDLNWLKKILGTMGTPQTAGSSATLRQSQSAPQTSITDILSSQGLKLGADESNSLSQDSLNNVINSQTGGNVLGSQTQVGGGSTGSGSGGGNAGKTNAVQNAGGGLSEAEAAELQRRARIDQYRNQARGIREGAQNTFSNLIEGVNSFRDRSNTLFTNAGQQILDTLSGILGNNARSGQAMARDARLRGRAMGLGDSSKFNLQNLAQGRLAGAQGEAMAKRGQEDRANQAMLDERMDTAQQQEGQARNYLNEANQYAQNVENAGYENANFDFEGNLQNAMARNNLLAQLQPLSAGGLSGYTPTDLMSLVSTINSSLPSMRTGSNTGDMAGNLQYNPYSFTDFMKRRQQR